VLLAKPCYTGSKDGIECAYSHRVYTLIGQTLRSMHATPDFAAYLAAVLCMQQETADLRQRAGLHLKTVIMGFWDINSQLAQEFVRHALLAAIVDPSSFVRASTGTVSDVR